jgi:hypothetical protein
MLFYKNSLMFSENERNVKLGYDEYDDPFIAPEVLFNVISYLSRKIKYILRKSTLSYLELFFIIFCLEFLL